MKPRMILAAAVFAALGAAVAHAVARDRRVLAEARHAGDVAQALAIVAERPYPPLRLVERSATVTPLRRHHNNGGAAS